MSDSAPEETVRVFVCEKCREAFTPSAEEAAELADLEFMFGLDAASCSALCAACQGASIQ